MRSVLLALVALTVAVVMTAVVGATLLYQRQPDLTALTDYRPKQPLRIYTEDGAEIGQFGSERRYLVPISQIPKQMQEAVLAIEDVRFREHIGVDARGVVRAVLTNLWRSRRSQGASTITQQVARTFYLSSRKTYMRKINEMLLAVKIERQLGKDQVLGLYMNQIFLGHRAYGFEAAAQAYFGKTMSALSLAECAMLAGLPQNPIYANPVANFERARQRQRQVLDRMRQAGMITAEAEQAARDEVLHIRTERDTQLHAEHVAEMARQIVFSRYGEAAYTLGLKVTTTLRSDHQQAAYRALRKGMLDFERRQPYRGPEDQEDIPAGLGATDAAVVQLLGDYRDDDDLRVAIVTEANPQQVVATLATGEVIQVRGEGLRAVQAALSSRARASESIRRGSVIRVAQDLGTSGQWAVRQWPDVEGAFVAVAPGTGRVRALVGGFDFNRNQFNHASQAWRQPGSTFKPFLYSAALEHGVMPATLINDAPLSLPGDVASSGWDPKNADGAYEGPMTMRQALAKSKNLVTIRLVKLMGPEAARNWTGRFGFDRPAARQPHAGPRRGADHAAAAGRGLRHARQRRLPRGADADPAHHRRPGQRAVRGAAGRIRREPAVGARAQRVHHEQPAQRGDPHRQRGPHAGPAQAVGPVRQDRHHQRRGRHLVRRLPAEPRGRRVDGPRQPAQPRRARVRRDAVHARLDRLHVAGPEGRARGDAGRARGRHQGRGRLDVHRVGLRRFEDERGLRRRDRVARRTTAGTGAGLGAIACPDATAAAGHSHARAFPDRSHVIPPLRYAAPVNTPSLQPLRATTRRSARRRR